MAPSTYLVSANQKVVSNLSSTDEVSWIWPASDAIINGEPVRRCPGPITSLGVVPNYVTLNEGWDGPGQGSASLKYYFVNGTNDMTNEQSEVVKALNEWAKYVQISWAQTSTANQSRTVDIKWATYDHGDSDPFDGPDGVVAHAALPPPDNSDSLAGDLHFDDSEDWDDYCYSGSPIDLYSLALHELGHSLGLGHSSNPDAVMYTPFDSYIDCHRSLHQDDIDGIRSIYASKGSCSITVTSPTGISNWATGTSHTIVWTSSDNPGSYVKIEFYNSSTSDDGSHSWTPSTSLADDSNYRIKISATLDSSCYDYSSYFTIYPPSSITITSPNGSECWEPGTSHTITWNSSGNPGSYVKIELYKGGVLNSTIKDSTHNDGSYPWPIPSSQIIGSDYKVRITSTSNSSYYDYSDDYFTIIASPSMFMDDFESYAAGSDLHDQGGWKGWGGDSAYGAPVSNAHAYSGSNSVEIGGNADLVHEFDMAGGRWELSAMQYIPSGTTGTTFFILLKTYSDGGPQNDWSVLTMFNLSTGVMMDFYSPVEVEILYDQWVELKFIIDLDENTVDDYYNGKLFSTHRWDDNDHGTLGAINLYGAGASSIYYDDIVVVAPAYNPKPADGATYENTWVTLEWSPGAFAVSHNVYFGEDFNEVKYGWGDTFRGNQPGTSFLVGYDLPGDPYPNGLELCTTYYWGIDEVGANGDTHTGEVWSLSIMPDE
ncbi:MAG: matrixin family metalloprotease, partial [Planctomycetota bacterium]